MKVLEKATSTLPVTTTDAAAINGNCVVRQHGDSLKTTTRCALGTQPPLVSCARQM
jgi:hypothetical protein